MPPPPDNLKKITVGSGQLRFGGNQEATISWNTSSEKIDNKYKFSIALTGAVPSGFKLSSVSLTILSD